MQINKRPIIFAFIASIVIVAVLTLIIGLPTGFSGGNTVWVPFVGAIVGGISSGLFTLFGVLFTWNYERNKVDAERANAAIEIQSKQQNQKRLLVQELKELRSVLMATRITLLAAVNGGNIDESSSLMHLQTDVWDDLRTELTWLHEDGFIALADVYASIKAMHTRWKRDKVVPNDARLNQIHDAVDNVLISFGEDTDFHAKRMPPQEL